MKYFAYGSNMSHKRLLARIPTASLIGIGELSEYDLRFHKFSKKDGSGKCDAYFTGNENDKIIGVIFDIPFSDLTELDIFEGVGIGYKRQEINVSESGVNCEATTYVATKIDTSLKPNDWYIFHVVFGAKSNSLPSDYILKIENTEYTPDPDRERYATEMSIYD